MWTTSVEGEDGAYMAMGLEVREEWTAADGSRRWTTRQAGPLRFPSTHDRERWQADGRPDLTPAPSEDRTRTGFSFGSEPYNYRELLDFPREPRALYERLRSAAVDCRCGNGVDSQTFVVAVEFLRTTPLPTTCVRRSCARSRSFPASSSAPSATSSAGAAWASPTRTARDARP